MNSIYLVLQTDYEAISIGIWNGTQKIVTNSINKMHACQQLMPSILTILQKQSLTFNDLSFIAVNQGPAPFTTLRIVITTANGLSFAHKIPLIGIDALTTFAGEHTENQGVTVCLLNAFAQDLYFAITENKIITTGCKNSNIFLEELSKQFSDQTLTFIGNGADLFKEKIKHIFNERALFATPNPAYTNFEQTARVAYHHWLAKTNISETVLPLYLKIQTYQAST